MASGVSSRRLDWVPKAPSAARQLCVCAHGKTGHLKLNWETFLLNLLQRVLIYMTMITVLRLYVYSYLFPISACILTVNVCLGFRRAWQGVVFDLLSVGLHFAQFRLSREEISEETDVLLSPRSVSG